MGIKYSYAAPLLRGLADVSITRAGMIKAETEISRSAFSPPHTASPVFMGILMAMRLKNRRWSLHFHIYCWMPI